MPEHLRLAIVREPGEEELMRPDFARRIVRYVTIDAPAAVTIAASTGAKNVKSISAIQYFP